MKKILIIALLMSTVFASRAQNVDLIGYGGYTFDEKVGASGGYYDYGKIAGSGMWGVAIDAYVRPDKSIILDFNSQNTSYILNPYYAGAPTISNGKISLSYLTIGGNQYFGANPKAKGYVGAAIGACFVSGSYDEQNSHYSTSGTRFAWNFHLGAKVYASERIGIRLQAQIHSPVAGAGVGMGFGTGGAGVGVTTYSNVLQFNLNGGLIIRVGGKK
ncbi:MAG: hypothetical protein C5B52_03825 [Bacteroidetes bacterium]|nr:MAG: hypothetical protein C5B52_03825 [Bacteroidota bacterium]